MTRRLTAPLAPLEVRDGQPGCSRPPSGLLMNLAGVILLFRYGMPYRVRTGGNELRFTGATDRETVKAERMYGSLGFLGLALIILGTTAQVVATLWSSA
jgi:hypothetical protein